MKKKIQHPKVITQDECEINKDLLISIIADQASASEFGRDVVRDILKCEDHKKFLFFDGYDEILPNQKEICNQILQIVKNWQSVLLFITTRSHALTELQNIFGIVGYTIWEVKDEPLIKYFETNWGNNGARINARLNGFAKKCLSALKRSVGQFFECEMIAGRPLQVALLRQLFNDKAIEYSIDRSKEFEFDITSLFDLYKKVVDIWKNKLKLSRRKSPKSKEKVFANGHMYAALKLLFPEQALKFKDILIGKMQSDFKELYACGILQKIENPDDDIDDTTPPFVHRTFAQYFLGLFVTRMLAYHTDFDWKFFTISTFFDFFVESVLCVKQLEVNLITSTIIIFGSECIKSYRFHYPVLSYFVDAHLKQNENSLLGGISPWTKDSDKVYNVLSACITHDFQALYAQTAEAHTRLLQENPSRLANLLLLSAKHSTLEQFKIIQKQAKDLLEKSPLSTTSTCGFQYVTPLHVAVQRGHFSIADFLLSTYPESEWQKVKHLLHCCIADSIYDNDNVILEKIRIIKLISLKNPECMNERLPGGMPPIFLTNVDSKLLECLVTCGVDLNVLYMGVSFLHKLPEADTNPESYHELASIIFARGFNHLNIPDYDQRTPFHLAMLKIELLKKTVKLFVLYGANFHAIDKSGDTILFYGVRGGRSTSLLSCVVSSGASLVHKNTRRENILHVCAECGNHEALEHFLQFPEIGPDEVNAANWPRCYTPLILAMMHEKKALSISLIELMEEKGLKMTRELASDALRKLNYNNALSRCREFKKLMDYFMERGGRLICTNSPRFDELSELRSDVLQKCFEPCVLEVSFKWWNETRYCSRKIQSFKFVEDSATHLESLITKQKSNTISDHLKHNLTTETACKWIHASVIGSHVNLLKLMIELETHKRLVEFELEDLLVLAVKYADEAVIDEVKQIYENQTRTKVQDFNLGLVNDTANHKTHVSILYVAALRGAFSVVNHILNMYGFSFMFKFNNVIRIHLPLGLCVCNTRKLNDDQISERIRIIDRLLQEFPTMIHETGNPNDDLLSPLLYPDIHFDLLLHLIRLGVNVSDVSEIGRCNILHCCPQYLPPMSLDQYDKLARELFRKDSQLYHSRDEHKQTPLHMAMHFFKLEEPTLELFFSAKVDFTTNDVDGRTVLHIAAHKDNVVGVKYFIKRGCDVNEKDEKGRTPLHHAFLADSGGNSAELVQVLLQHGANVNAIDKEKNTPLHHLFSTDVSNKQIPHEVVEALLQHGADVNKANKDSDTSLSLALKCYKRYDVVIEKRTIEMIKEASNQ